MGSGYPLPGGFPVGSQCVPSGFLLGSRWVPFEAGFPWACLLLQHLKWVAIKGLIVDEFPGSLGFGITSRGLLLASQWVRTAFPVGSQQIPLVIAASEVRSPLRFSWTHTPCVRAESVELVSGCRCGSVPRAPTHTDGVLCPT